MQLNFFISVFLSISVQFGQQSIVGPVVLFYYLFFLLSINQTLETSSLIFSTFPFLSFQRGFLNICREFSWRVWNLDHFTPKMHKHFIWVLYLCCIFIYPYCNGVLFIVSYYNFLKIARFAVSYLYQCLYSCILTLFSPMFKGRYICKMKIPSQWVSTLAFWPI